MSESSSVDESLDRAAAAPAPGSPGRIRLLPEALIGKIAAGEVVERPASVVKELVENALDAGARRIAVELEDGGVRLIRVTDDGEGMAATDAPLAFRRHATSKIRNESDLARIVSLGFRGEALPSIAAVAAVELTTRARGAATGVRVRAEGGDVSEVREAGTAEGTVVTVRELFAPVPARRKFLKSVATELGHVVELVLRVSLAAPAVHFRLLHQGREVAVHPPVTSLEERVRQVFGTDKVRGGRAFADEREGIGLAGFLLSPHLSFASARYLHIYVNGRPVRDRGLAHAVSEGYASLIPRGRWPGAVVMVSLEPEEVDVNVHPAKHEVRFREPRVVHDAVLAAVRRALSRATGLTERPAAEGVAEALHRYAARQESGGAASLQGGPWPGRTRGERGAGHVSPPLTGQGDAGAPDSRPVVPRSGVPDATQETPSPVAAGETPLPFSALRVLGQVFRGYLVCEGPDRLVLVDQHAAAERIAFERLRAQLRGGAIERQALLLPLPVDLEPRRLEALAAAQAELATLGFELEAFGERTVLVRAVPALLGADDPRLLVEDLADGLAELGSHRSVADAFETILGRIACHSVIRVGRTLAAAEVAGLLADLDGLSFGSSCPHGRPVSAELTRGQLERMFGR